VIAHWGTVSMHRDRASRSCHLPMQSAVYFYIVFYSEAKSAVLRASTTVRTPHDHACRHLVEGREQLVSLSREDLGVELPLVSLELARRPDGHEVAADGQVDDRWASDLYTSDGGSCSLPGSPPVRATSPSMPRISYQ